MEAIKIKSSEDIKNEHKAMGYFSCSRCGRPSGLKYHYPDGKLRGITLKKIGKELICLDCLAEPRKEA